QRLGAVVGVEQLAVAAPEQLLLGAAEEGAAGRVDVDQLAVLDQRDQRGDGLRQREEARLLVPRRDLGRGSLGAHAHLPPTASPRPAVTRDGAAPAAG